jgi:hypothetical protein
MHVYGKVKIHFGNLWAFASMLIIKSREEGVVYVTNKMKRKSLVLEMLSHFDTTGSNIVWVDEGYSGGQRKYGVRNHRRPFAKTKVQWKEGPYKRICYQLNTKSNNPRFTSKKMPQEEIDKLLTHLSKSYELVEVGLPYTIGESINIMATSDAFIGICSGMSQVAHSVGVPTYLYWWKQLGRCHRKKKYKAFKNLEELELYGKV